MFKLPASKFAEWLYEADVEEEGNSLGWGFRHLWIVKDNPSYKLFWEAIRKPTLKLEATAHYNDQPAAWSNLSYYVQQFYLHVAKEYIECIPRHNWPKSILDKLYGKQRSLSNLPISVDTFTEYMLDHLFPESDFHNNHHSCLVKFRYRNYYRVRSIAKRIHKLPRSQWPHYIHDRLLAERSDLQRC